MKKFEVTVTRTGGVIVMAGTADEAYDKVISMSTEDINGSLGLTGWEPSDITVLDSEEQGVN